MSVSLVTKDAVAATMNSGPWNRRIDENMGKSAAVVGTRALAKRFVELRCGFESGSSSFYNNSKHVEDKIDRLKAAIGLAPETGLAKELEILKPARGHSTGLAELGVRPRANPLYHRAGTAGSQHSAITRTPLLCPIH